MSQIIYLFIICANLLIHKLCSAQPTTATTSITPEDISNNSDLIDQVIDGDRSLTTQMAESLIDLLFRINWPALFVKLLKTLVAFMIDVIAGSMLGRSGLTSPLTSF